MIYELWMWKNHQSANNAYAKISLEEEKVLNEVFTDEVMKRYGAKWLLYCESAWANEEIRNWGITTYPDIKSRIEQTRAIEKAGWFRYADMFSLMGTLDMQEGVPQMPDFPNPIYLLWIMRSNPVAWANYARLTKAEEADLWTKWGESVNRTGACMVLNCNSGWCNEAMPNFGIMAFPSIEARQEHEADTRKLSWPLYFDAFTLLGVAT